MPDCLAYKRASVIQDVFWANDQNTNSLACIPPGSCQLVIVTIRINVTIYIKVALDPELDPFPSWTRNLVTFLKNLIWILKNWIPIRNRFDLLQEYIFFYLVVYMTILVQKQKKRFFSKNKDKISLCKKIEFTGSYYPCFLIQFNSQDNCKYYSTVKFQFRTSSRRRASTL